jgi:preprotein translocase subunit SecE
MSEQITPRGTTPRGPAPTGGASVAGGPVDVAWVVAAVALLLAGLVGYYWLSASPIAVRIACVVGGLALGVGAFAMSGYGRDVWGFVQGSRVELRKMVWPTMPDTRQITFIVIVFVFVLGVFFWVVDRLLAWATRLLLGTGG